MLATPAAPLHSRAASLPPESPVAATESASLRFADIDTWPTGDLVDGVVEGQFAAIAACRANPDVWPALESAVIAHLTPPRQGYTLQDDEQPLMLALVRFGKKDLVAGMIEKRGLFDKRTPERLAKLEPGFAPEHCRAPL